MFLDDMTPEQLSQRLGVKITQTGGSGDELFRNMFRAPVMGNGGEYNAR